MSRIFRTSTLSLLAGFAMAFLFTVAAPAQTPTPQPPAPTTPPPVCDIAGVPSCAEAGKVAKATITVSDSNNRPILGAQVRLGTTISGTTGLGGKHDIAATCGAAGSTIEVNVYVNGKLCGTKTIHCYDKDKDDQWIMTAAQIATTGAKVLTTKNLLSSQSTLTFDGTTFAGPRVAELAIGLNVSKTSSGNLIADITSYNAVYENFSAAGYDFGQTEVVLKRNDANYLSINQETGEVNGFLQTLIYNDVVEGLERHLHLTGTFDGEILELNVAGFLIETGPSPVVHDADDEYTIGNRDQ